MTEIKCIARSKSGACLRYNFNFWDDEHFPGGYAGG